MLSRTLLAVVAVVFTTTLQGCNLYGTDAGPDACPGCDESSCSVGGCNMPGRGFYLTVEVCLMCVYVCYFLLILGCGAIAAVYCNLLRRLIGDENQKHPCFMWTYYTGLFGLLALLCNLAQCFNDCNAGGIVIALLGHVFAVIFTIYSNGILGKAERQKYYWAEMLLLSLAAFETTGTVAFAIQDVLYSSIGLCDNSKDDWSDIHSDCMAWAGLLNVILMIGTSMWKDDHPPGYCDAERPDHQ